MAELPWYAHYEGDYQLKTAWFHCAAQHGIYRAIVAYLNMHGALENVNEARAVSRASEQEWAEHWPAILRRMLIVDKDGKIDQGRAREERDRRQRKSKKRSKAGKDNVNKRWAKKRAAGHTEEPAPETPSGEALTPVDEAVARYNAVAAAAKLPLCQVVTKARATKIMARLKSCDGLPGWDVALEKVKRSAFLTGKTAKDGWTADLDFMLQQSSFTKIMEGRYDDRKRHNGAPTLEERRAAILKNVGAGRMGDNGPAAGPSDAGDPE